MFKKPLFSDRLPVTNTSGCRKTDRTLELWFRIAFLKVNRPIHPCVFFLRVYSCKSVGFTISQFVIQGTRPNAIEASYKDIDLCDTTSVGSDILWY
jgi:hypothetical protein